MQTYIFFKLAPGKGLEGLEVGKQKPKVGVNAIFFYDSYKIANHISVQSCLSTATVTATATATKS